MFPSLALPPVGSEPLPAHGGGDSERDDVPPLPPAPDAVPLVAGGAGALPLPGVVVVVLWPGLGFGVVPGLRVVGFGSGVGPDDDGVDPEVDEEESAGHGVADVEEVPPGVPVSVGDDESVGLAVEVPVGTGLGGVGVGVLDEQVAADVPEADVDGLLVSAIALVA
jgi:hypothetical protein